MRKIEREIVGGFIFSNDGKTLLGLQDTGSAYAGLWVVLGGGIDEGETKEQALQRELLEEGGLDISRDKVTFIERVGPDTREKTLKSTGERVQVEMYFNDYEVHIDKPADEIPVRPNEEFEQLAWIDIADLPKLNVAAMTYACYKKMGYVS